MVYEFPIMSYDPCPGDIVRPYGMWLSQAWSGTVRRTEGGKALVGITSIQLQLDLARRCTPPILAWVDVDSLELA